MSALTQLKLFFQGESGVAISYPPGGSAWFAGISGIVLLFCLYWLYAGLKRKISFASLPWGWKLLSNISFIVGFFLLWELLLTYYIHSHSAFTMPKTLPHPQLVWMQTPGARYEENGFEVAINSQGLREREIPQTKAPGEYRILCLGDSNTFGHFLPVEASFPRQLEAVLRATMPSRMVTVLNGGVQGYSIMQAYYLFKEIGLKYHPDMIIVNPLHDVTEFGNGYKANFSVAGRETGFPGVRKLQRLLFKLNIFLTLRSEHLRFNSLRLKDAKSVRDKPELALDETEQINAREREYFVRQFMIDCEHHGITALFVNTLSYKSLLPLIHPGNEDSKILFLELPINRLFGDPARYTLVNDASHLNAAGNLEMAKWVASVITRPPPASNNITGTIVYIEGGSCLIKTDVNLLLRIETNTGTIFSPSRPQALVLGRKVETIVDAGNVCTQLNLVTTESEFDVPPAITETGGPNSTRITYQAQGKWQELNDRRIRLITATGRVLDLKLTAKTICKPDKNAVRLRRTLTVTYNQADECLELLSGLMPPTFVTGTLISMRDNVLQLRTPDHKVLQLSYSKATILSAARDYFKPGLGIALHYDQGKECIDIVATTLKPGKH